MFLFLACTVILAAAVWTSASADEIGDVTLRVLLRRLNIDKNISVKTESIYLIRGGNGAEMLLQPGTVIDIELRDSSFIGFLEGASLSFGKSMQLLQCSSGGEAAGLRLMNSSGIYPGNLALTSEDGKIRPVLSVAMEDYLLGVVPYEMNDSFPPEALKAQAVCARTYAARRMNQSRDYDVVDTTNDQVFKGVSSSNRNAAQVVADTAGLVITVNGKIADGF